MRFYVLSIILFFSFQVSAQETFEVALDAITDPANQHFSFDRSDLLEYRIHSQHSRNGIQYAYVQQQRYGIDIENAILSLVLDPQKEVISAQHSMLPDLQNAIPSRIDPISPKQALESAAKQLNLSAAQSLPVDNLLRNKPNPNEWFFTQGTLSRMTIPVKLLWVNHDKAYQLAYRIGVWHPQENHYWSLYISAINGDLLKMEDRILQCRFDKGEPLIHDHFEGTVSELILNNEDQSEIYNVYPLYQENPGQGERVIVVNPSDPVASPFGWHDIDGIPGPDYFDTRGNNAFVQEDFNYNNSGGRRADGGENLIFDFQVDFLEGPKSYVDASLTNLFYWVNLNHDIFYHYGFDEESGNFQINNYDRGGLGQDQVFADAQDGSGQNNAQFLTLEEGLPARMEMFIWGTTRAVLEIEGNSRAAREWIGPESGFQGGLNAISRQGPQSGPVVIVRDQSGNSAEACSVDPIGNREDLDGAVALIDRGNCTFTEKVLNAQNAGAVACVICNDSPGTFTMGGTSSQVKIPAMMLSREDCSIIKQVIQQGTSLEATIRNSGEADNLDSALDNLIVTHEYGHGISNRLTGGKNSTSCLNNTEQMGEGWSDYFGLMLTTDWTTAKASDARPVGNWLLKQEQNERGIRPFPYSYNKAINPMTYSDIKRFSVPHGVGAVWCAMLWDMTWEIIAQEGEVSADIYNGTGGNNIALQLVIEGLKIQNCNPGFVDGRDAILAADQLLYEGKHHIAIWKAFARRGLGAGADQKSSFSVEDGRSSSELPTAFISKAEDFSAVDSANVIVLNWKSIREIDNKAYRILRSTDNKLFDVIDQIPGLSFSTEPRSLTYIDQNVTPGVWYYYKLESQDESLRTRPQGLDSAIVINTNDLVIFPNPSSGIFQMVISDLITSPVDLYIYNIQGQEILRRRFEDPSLLQNIYTLNLAQFSAGTYILKMYTDQDNFTRKLFIK